MQKHLLGLTALASVLFLSFFSVLFFSKKKENHPPRPSRQTATDRFRPEEKSLLREGDIVLRRGEGSVSDFIVAFLKETYPVTHCGVVVRRDDGLWVISSESTPDADGIRCDPLTHFAGYARNGSLAAVRPRLDEAQRTAFLHASEWYLSQGKAFDKQFDMADTTKFYCAELMYHLFFRATGTDFLPARKPLAASEVVHMDNFFAPERFELLFNHAEKTAF